MPKTAPRRSRFRWRLWLPVAAVLVAFASTAWGAKSVRLFLASDPRFALLHPHGGRANEGVVVFGATYTSPANVQQIFERDYGRSVYSIDLAERRRHLLAIDWIENATVERIWPNHIYVRIHERKPVAFVAVPHRSFALVDGEGVLLPTPAKAHFDFPVLTGISLGESESERKVRVQAALRLLEDLGPAAREISEVNTAVPDDLRVIAEAKGKAVELLLGDGNFAARYRNWSEHAADLRAGSPAASVFDLRIDDRITAH